MSSYYKSPEDENVPDWDELVGSTQTPKPKQRPRQDYTELAKRISKEEGFDENITLAVMKQESAGRDKAVSPKGASGLMQLMPATAKARGVTDIFDPEQNIRAGVRELKQHYTTNKGDLPKTLASYNWGSGNLQKKGLQNAPKETRDYIKNISANLGKPVNLSSTPEQDNTPDWDELVSGKASTPITRPRRVNNLQQSAVAQVKPSKQPSSKIDWNNIRIDDTKQLPSKTIASKIASGEKIPTVAEQRSSYAKNAPTSKPGGVTTSADLRNALEYKKQQDLEARALNPSLRSPQGMQDYNKAVQASRKQQRLGGNKLAEVENVITDINDAINPILSDPNTPIIGDVPGQAVRGLTAGTLGSREEPSTLGGALANVGGQFAPDIAAIGLTGGLGAVKNIASLPLRSAVGTGLGLGLAQTGREAISGQLGSDQATKNILTKTAAGALGGGLSEIVPVAAAGTPIKDILAARAARTGFGAVGNLPFEGLNAIDAISQGKDTKEAIREALLNSILQAGAGELGGSIGTGINKIANQDAYPMPGRQGQQLALNPSPLDPNYAQTKPLNYDDLATTQPLDYNDLANTIALPAKQPRFNPILKGGIPETGQLSAIDRTTQPMRTEPFDATRMQTERLTSIRPESKEIALPPIQKPNFFPPFNEVSPYATREMPIEQVRQPRQTEQQFNQTEPLDRSVADNTNNLNRQTVRGFDETMNLGSDQALSKFQTNPLDTIGLSPRTIPDDNPINYQTKPFNMSERYREDNALADNRRQGVQDVFNEYGGTGYVNEAGKPFFMSPYDRDPGNGGLPPLSQEFLLNQSSNPTGQIPFARRRLQNAPVSEKQDVFGQNKLRLPELKNTYPLNINAETKPIGLEALPVEAPSVDALQRAGLIRPKRQIQQNETGANQPINPNSADLTAILGDETPTQIMQQEGSTPIQGLIPADTPPAGETVNPYMDTNYLNYVLGKPADFNPYQTNEIQPGLSNKEINQIMINPGLKFRGVQRGRPRPFYRVLPEETNKYGFGTQEQADHMSRPRSETGFIPPGGSVASRSTKTNLNAPIDRPVVQGDKALFDPFKYDKNSQSENLSTKRPATPEEGKSAYDFFKQLENPNEPLAIGPTGELHSPYFDKPVKYNPAIMDLDQLLASHDPYLNERPGFPKEYQPRDRKLSAQAFYGEGGTIPKYNPALINRDSISPAEGRPTVDYQVDAQGKRKVLSGNKRELTQEIIYQNYPEKVKELQQEMINNPPRGMTSDQVREAIAKAKKPISVNILKQMSDSQKLKFARIANEPNIEDYSPLERARVDAASIDINKIEKIGGTGDLTARENDNFVQDFINKIATPANRGKLYKNGELTQEGVRRVQNALFIKAFGDSPETLRILSDITESTSADYKNIANALASKAPRIAQVKELGNTDANYDISNDLMVSLNQYANLRKSGLSVDDYIKQKGVAELTDNQKSLLKLFDETKRSPNQLKQTLDNYLDTAQKEVKTNAQQESLFGSLGEEKGQVLSSAVDKTVQARAEAKAKAAEKKAKKEKSIIDKLLGNQIGAINPRGKGSFFARNNPNQSNLPGIPANQAPTQASKIPGLGKYLSRGKPTISPNQPNLPGMPAAVNQAPATPVKEQPLLKTISSTIKANMLANPASALGDTIGTGGRLIAKNLISDTVRNAVDKQLAKIGQVQVDPNNPGQFIKSGTNERTFIKPDAKEIFNNIKSGAQGIAGAKNLVFKQNLTPNQLAELLQHEAHTKGSSKPGAKGAGLRALDGYVNTVGRVRAAFDEPAYQYALNDAKQAIIKTEASNKGVPQAQLETAVKQVQDFQDGKINQITVHPRLRQVAEQILKDAKTDAMYETLRDDNAFSKRFSDFKNKLWEGGTGKQAIAFVIDQAAPFARTGTNIIRQAGDMSIGGLYNIQKLMRESRKQGGFTIEQQKSIAKSVGDVAMGAIVGGLGAGLSYAGYANKNTFFNPLSGENKQERTLNEAANREGGSTRIPGTNRRITAHVLGTTKPIYEFGIASQKILSDPELSKQEKVSGIADQIVNSALEHPAATATRDLAMAFFSPSKADALYKQAVKRAATLVTPKIVEQLSTRGKEVRQVETEGDLATDLVNEVMNRWPGRSSYNQPKYTALGDQNKYSALNFIDPFRSKEERITPVTQELTKQNVGLSPLQRNKEKGETAADFAERSKDVGKFTNQQLDKLVKSDLYGQLPSKRAKSPALSADTKLTDRKLREELIKDTEKASHSSELRFPIESYVNSLMSRIDAKTQPIEDKIKKQKLKALINLGGK